MPLNFSPPGERFPCYTGAFLILDGELTRVVSRSSSLGAELNPHFSSPPPEPSPIKGEGNAGLWERANDLKI
jgi:hypothetical protein